MVNFGKLQNKKVLVIGDIMVDDYLYCYVGGKSAEVDIDVNKLSTQEWFLGGCANVYNNLKGLGATPYLCGAIGDDKYGNFVADSVKNDKYLVHAEKTTCKHRFYIDNKQMFRYDEDFVFTTIEAYDNLIHLIEKNIHNFDAIILSDYKKGFCNKNFISKIISIANKNNIFVAVDSKDNRVEKYAGVNLLKVNKTEFFELFHSEIFNTQQSVITNFLKNLNINELLVTLGERGMILFDAQGNKVYQEAKKQTVADVVGAGDCVISCYVVATLSDMSAKEKLIYCAEGAGFCVNKIATKAFDMFEYMEENDGKNC